MKKLLLLLPLITLLTACQSKREICARHASGQMDSDVAAKKLNIKKPSKGSWLPGIVDQYCAYYRN